MRDKRYWKSSRNLLPVALKVEVRTCLLGKAVPGSGREQVNDLRVVATRGPRGSGGWSLSRPPLSS